MSVQLIDFRPHTWETWQAEYRPHIKCHVEWKKLKRPKVEVLLFTEAVDGHVVYPWREGGGSWMDSDKFQFVKLGTAPLLLRVPAVLLSGPRYLLLDGCHRVEAFNPWALILDYLVLESGDERYFADLREVKSEK